LISLPQINETYFIYQISIVMEHNYWQTYLQ
jgi:hypothetical protein